MKLSALAVMEIEGVQFKILNCSPLFTLKNKDVLFSEQALKKFLEPLSSKDSTEQYVEDIVFGIKKHGYKFCLTSDPATFLMFKGIEKYRVFLQRENDTVLGFLLYKLSSEEMQDIEDKKVMGYTVEDDSDDENIH